MIANLKMLNKNYLAKPFLRVIDQSKLGIEAGSKKSYMPKETQQMEEMERILAHLSSKDQRRLIDVNLRLSTVSGLRMIAEYLQVKTDSA